MTDTPDLNWLISVDDHVVEPPDTFEGRIPKRFLDGLENSADLIRLSRELADLESPTVS